MWLLLLMLLVSILAQTKNAVALLKGPGCGALLTDEIVNKAIEVSGSVNASFDEKHALLNGSNAWCSAEVNTLQYLIIKLGKPARITGFDIQGDSSSHDYVTKFVMGYKATKTKQRFQAYQSEPFYSTLSSGDEIAHFPLNATVMQAVAFYPHDWSVGRICMRVELYGCVPVDGGYTPWSDWSYCSNSCGNGTKVRYRQCINPVPTNNGRNCSGDSLQIKNCVGTSCPVDGGLSKWSKWTCCSATCGTGVQLRFRSCTNPPPKHGGKVCEGKSSESSTCLVDKCEVQSVNTRLRTSDDDERNNKYFILTVVLAVALVVFIVITIGVYYLRKKLNMNEMEGDGPSDLDKKTTKHYPFLKYCKQNSDVETHHKS